MPVVGFEGLYEVSDQGQVRSLDRVVLRRGHAMRQRGCLLKPGATKAGYPLVVPCKNGKPRSQYVHHLVLKAFAGPCPDGMECLHGDGNPGNARLDNLSWGTPIENAADQFRHGTKPRGERCSWAKITAAQVLEIRADARPQTQIAKSFGISRQNVSIIKRRLQWAWVAHGAAPP